MLVNAGKTYFSETFPEAWLFLMAALFIGVTMAFPMGLAGVWQSHVKPWWARRRLAMKTVAVPGSEPASVAPLRAAEPLSRSETDGPPLPDRVRGQGV